MITGFQGIDLAALGIDPTWLASLPASSQASIGELQQNGLAQAIAAQIAQSEPTAQNTGAASFGAAPAPNPEIANQYDYFNKLASGGTYDFSNIAAPQLMPASGNYSTPYFATYTNDNDFAGAVMAAPGQKIRMVDKTTGEVVFEGEGPEGAKMAAALANAVSREKGRKAAWQIDLNEGGQWNGMASDAVNKKKGILGKLADIVLPVLGAALMPVTGGMSAALAAGLGAAGGSALSSVAQGRSLEDTLKRAALSGIGAGVVGPAVGKAAGNVLGGAQSSLAADAARLAAQSSAGGALAQQATSSILAGLPANLSTVLPGAVSSAGGNLLGELIVTAAPNAVISVPAGALAGSITGGALSSSPSRPQTANDQTPTVSEVVATASKEPLISPGAVAAGAAAGAASPTLLKAIQSGDPKQVGEWAKNNPLQAAALGLTVAGAFGGAGQQGGQTYGIPTGAGAPGTRGSLSSLYSAQLPSASLPGAATRQANDMSGTDWLRYGFGPEKQFFRPQGLKRGGMPMPQRSESSSRTSFAVVGDGDGREDLIPARLSDGEYVMDAETVALLGNGSSKAGAAKLDQFRVNIRKHKGRSLAKGKFSVDAKRPEAYFSGGRV